ncbi:MAG: hypothetical protein ACTSWX_10170 [Promethearchaeota archaeon]
MNEKSHIFDKKIQIYEKTIIDYFIDMGKDIGRNEIESQILAYFMIHHRLTQKQIQDLSQIYYIKNSKRGISNGTISTFLNNINNNFYLIKKRRINPTKNLYIYSMQKKIRHYFSENQFKVLDYINDSIEFFNKILLSMKDFPKEKIADLNLYNLFSDRLEEFMSYLKSYKHIVESSIDMGNEEKKIISGFRKVKQIKFDGSLEKLEKRIIKYLVNSPLHVFQKKSYCQIMGYFITRKNLTQKELKELTNLSTGHISQGLKHLVENGIIEAQKIKGIREGLYSMNTITESLLSRYVKALNLGLEWREKLIEMNSELEERKEELQHLNGYYQIKEFITQSIELKKYYSKLKKFIKKELRS